VGLIVPGKVPILSKSTVTARFSALRKMALGLEKSFLLAFKDKKIF